jgi:hypothetical protein
LQKGIAMQWKLRVLTLVGLALAQAGCGSRSVTGGTEGVLRYHGKLLGDIQVTVYQVEGSHFEPIGFGITASDGSFHLVKNGARGPLRLSPGQYRCTLESAGNPLRIAAPFAHADTTPLVVSWSAGDKSLDLDAPISPSP